MTHNAPLVDVAIGVAVAILVLILAPGYAVVAIIAIGVLLVVGVSFAFTGWRGRLAGRRGDSAKRNFRGGGGF